MIRSELSLVGNIWTKGSALASCANNPVTTLWRFLYPQKDNMTIYRFKKLLLEWMNSNLV